MLLSPLTWSTPVHSSDTSYYQFLGRASPPAPIHIHLLCPGITVHLLLFKHWLMFWFSIHPGGDWSVVFTSRKTNWRVSISLDILSLTCCIMFSLYWKQKKSLLNEWMNEWICSTCCHQLVSTHLSGLHIYCWGNNTYASSLRGFVQTLCAPPQSIWYIAGTKILAEINGYT